MANFINKYLDQSAYDADSTKQFPNTSLVGTDVVFKMSDEPEPVAFGGLTVKYNIEDPTSEVTLFNGGGASSSTSSSESESGGGGAMPSKMYVDGNEETPINTWRFETAGEHIVQYEFADNIVPGGFLSNNPIYTEVIVGDNITKIGNVAFYNVNDVGILTSATIGTGIESIGEQAFSGNINMTSLTINTTTPPTLIGHNSFTNTNDCPIYVPAESVNTYRTTSVIGWDSYTERIQAIQ